MVRERAKSVDQRSFGRSSTAEAAGKLASADHGFPATRSMLAFAPLQGGIRGVSGNLYKL